MITGGLLNWSPKLRIGSPCIPLQCRNISLDIKWLINKVMKFKSVQCMLAAGLKTCVDEFNLIFIARSFLIWNNFLFKKNAMHAHKIGSWKCIKKNRDLLVDYVSIISITECTIFKKFKQCMSKLMWFYRWYFVEYNFSWISVLNWSTKLNFH